MRLLFAFLLGLVLLGQGPQKFILPNGLEVIVVEQHDRPLLRAKLQAIWGEAEAPLPAELALLTRLLQPGAGASLGEAEDARAEFRFEAGQRALSWTTVSPSAEQEVALGLMAQQVFRTALEPAGVEQVRRSLRAAYREASPELLAQDRFFGLLGHPTPLFGEHEAALDRVTYEALLRLRRSLLRPERSRLVLQGDLSLEQARQLALLHFGTWHGEGTVEVKVASSPAPRFVVSAQAARSLEVWVALPGNPAGTLWRDRVARALALSLRRAPSPFATASLAEAGTDGTLLLRFTAPMRVGSLTSLKVVQELLEGLRNTGLPAPLWQEAGREADAFARIEALHPAAWTRRLAREGASETPVPRSTGELNAELAKMLAPEGLRFLVLGAEPDARPVLEGAGFKPLIWMNR